MGLKNLTGFPSNIVFEWLSCKNIPLIKINNKPNSNYITTLHQGTTLLFLISVILIVTSLLNIRNEKVLLRMFHCLHHYPFMQSNQTFTDRLFLTFHFVYFISFSHFILLSHLLCSTTITTFDALTALLHLPIVIVQIHPHFNFNINFFKGI